MIHLIVNLKSYLMFEVLEGGWRRLGLEIEAAKTLDEVIETHRRYLNGIVCKSLLQTGMEDIAQQQLAEQVQTLLVITGEFCDLQVQLFHDPLVAASIAAEKHIEANCCVEQGRWGFDLEQDITNEEFFWSCRQRNLATSCSDI
jgi:hypothetical protein